MPISSQTDCVLVSYEGRVATLTLNRPEVLNALDVSTLENLVVRLKEIKESDCDVVVLTGSGRGFSSGGDIKSMLSAKDDSSFPYIMSTISELITTLYSLPKIVISAIHGPAAGLGLSLALAADYIIADASAVVAMNFIGIALIPDGGGHYFMQQRLGETKAKQLIWQGKKLNAEQALKVGLVDEVVAENFQDAVKGRVASFLSAPTGAMIQTKQIYTEMNLPTLEKILQLEKEGQGNMRKTVDHREGVQSFLEKRLPVFKGK